MSTADEVIAAARSQSGLTDFGSDSFHDGLVALLDGVEKAGSFNELGLAVVRDQAIGFLKNRLSVEDWYSRHPEIDDAGDPRRRCSASGSPAPDRRR